LIDLGLVATDREVVTDPALGESGRREKVADLDLEGTDRVKEDDLG
jgi:hypothetical protein